MATENQVDVLVNVDIKARDAISEVIRLNGVITSLKEQQKNLGALTDENAVKYFDLSSQIKVSQKELQGYNRQIQAGIKADQAQANSLDELRARLSALTAEHARYGDEVKNQARKNYLSNQIVSITKEVNTQEQELLNFRRNVGNYTNSIGMATNQIVRELPAAGISFATFISAISNNIPILVDQIDNVREANKKLAADGKKTVPIGKAITSAIFSWQSAMILALTAIQILGPKIQEFFSNLGKGRKQVVDTDRAIRSMRDAMDFKDIGEQIVNFKRLSDAYKAVGDSADDKKKFIEKYKDEFDKLHLSITDVNSADKALIDGTQDFIKSVSNRAMALAGMQKASEIYAEGIERIGEVDKDLATSERALSSYLSRIGQASAMGGDQSLFLTTRISESLSRQAELATKRKEIYDQMVSDADIFIKASQKLGGSIEDDAARAEDAIVSSADNSASAVENSVDRIYEESIRRSELLQKVTEAEFSAEATAVDESIKVRLTREAELFAIQQNGERERLDLQRANGKISEDEYAAHLQIMAAEQKAFGNRQSSELNDFFQREVETIVGMVEKTFDEEIAAVEEQYNDAISRLNETQIAETEEAQMEMAKLIIRLEDQKAAKVKEIRDAANVEAQSADQKLVDQTLNRELLEAQGNAKKRYDAKVKALNAEAEIYADNADKQLEISQALFDAEQELTNARVDNLMKWRDAALDVYNSVAELTNARSDAEAQKVQETYDREKQYLADKHAQGLTTEAQYNAEMIRLDQKKAKDDAKIERDKAIRERVGKVFSVVTDTAAGVAKAVASSPLTFGLPWSAFTAATGALQLATILAQPLPKAARGGLIVGPSHAAGGTVIEAEGGEVVINKRSASMFGPVLSALNALGGGVPFSGPLSDGGYMLRAASGGGGATAAEIADAFRSVKIVTAIEDINRGQEKYAQIQSAGSLFGN